MVPRRTPKFVLIGAGSVSFGLMTILDLMRCPELHGSDIALVDIAPDRLERMTRLAHRINETWQAGFRITSTIDRCEALPGADIVVVAVERDRYKLWNMDREIPRKHGVIQLEAENGGPGGMFHTFRQVPVLLPIARDVERLCPQAWLVNMSNPESRLTLLMHRYTKVKSVGVCLGAYITRHVLATQVLGLDPADVDVKAAGINHCHWVLDIRHARTSDAIVEVPAIVGADRIYGLAVGDLPPAIAALMELQLRIMDLVVEAGVTGDRRIALEALLIDPAIPSPTAAEKILDEMLIAEAEYLPQFS